jgi:alanine-glyoxylate transaminase/serine-glyoxylate transaminase/serine-pyruvate transaminase
MRRAVAKWAEGQVLDFNVSKASERSNTVTTVLMAGDHDPVKLHRYAREKCGIGELQGQAFRIAQMGQVNAPMVLGVLGVIEVALKCARNPARPRRCRSRDRRLGESVRA